MYVRKHRGPDGVLRLRAAHLPTAHEMTSEESDRHKAMKDFLARTGQSAGLQVQVEMTTKNRTSRPDVTITGAGGISLGCEAQYYNASAGTVLRRSKAHAEAGLTANWITHDDRFHLIDRSNWMLTREMTWKEISDAADIALMGGFRVLVEWRCTATAERPCPDAKVKTGCGKVHLQWDTPRRLDDEGTGWTGHKGNTRAITVGQTLVKAATGSVTPLFASSRKDQRSGAYMWVSVADKSRWNDYRSEEAAAPDEDQAQEEPVHFSGRDADTTCSFGADTWIPSAPLERRGIQSVELTITADDPAPVRTAQLAPASFSLDRSQVPAPASPDVQQPNSWPSSLSEERATSISARTHLATHLSAMPRPWIPAQPLVPAIETVEDSSADRPALISPTIEPEPSETHPLAALIALQRAADHEREKLNLLDAHDERNRQRQAWLQAAATVQDAVTRYARAEQVNRVDIEQKVRRASRDGDVAGGH
ncbi:competence protein CoiA family protein [Streptomyces sp. NPDC001288]